MPRSTGLGEGGEVDTQPGIAPISTAGMLPHTLKPSCPLFLSPSRKRNYGKSEEKSGSVTFSGTRGGTHSHSRRCRSSKTRGFSCVILLWLRNLEPVQGRRVILRHRCQLNLLLLKLFFPSCLRPLASGAPGTISLSGSSAGSQLRLENTGMGTAVFAGGEMPLLCPMFAQNTCNSSLKHA